MKKTVLSFIIAAFVMLFSFSAFSSDNNLYVVKYGDTLWDLSKQHYKDPFLWGKIWINNTYINDPNLIFPGEVIQFTKNGITIYKKPIKHIVKKQVKKSPMFVKYDSPVFFDGEKYYSDCGGGFCIWNKDAFRVGDLSFDRYNHLEVAKDANVYITTKKPVGCCKNFYIYRQLRDYLSASVCPNEPKDVYYPIAEIKVEKMIKPCVYKGKVVRASEEVSPKDVVSIVYPYKKILTKPHLAHLGNLPVEIISVNDTALTKQIGYYLFCRVPKSHWQIKKRKWRSGYHIVKEPKPFVQNIVGCSVMLDRVNHNMPENINIGEGVVVSQYKNYIAVFFDTYNSKLREMVDRTKEYVLR